MTRKFEACNLSDVRGQQVVIPDKRTKLAKRQPHELRFGEIVVNITQQRTALEVKRSHVKISRDKRS